MDDNALQVLFSSKTDDHSTPQDFFNKLNEQYQFDLDVCATESNAKCEKFFTREQDALKQDWKGACWMNPPYGRDIINWMRKAYEEHKKNKNLIVCLVPVRTDTNWWHSYVEGKAKVKFIKGRLKFGNAQNSAPFPSALVIYQPRKKRSSK
jgi:phage N-6-adenine-methyltransferase